MHKAKEMVSDLKPNSSSNSENSGTNDNYNQQSTNQGLGSNTQSGFGSGSTNQGYSNSQPMGASLS